MSEKEYRIMESEKARLIDEVHYFDEKACGAVIEFFKSKTPIKPPESSDKNLESYCEYLQRDNEYLRKLLRERGGAE